MACRQPVRDGISSIKPEWRERLGEDHEIDLGVLGAISDTALTREAAIDARENGLPNTFVSGRNIIFLTFAAAIAYRRNLAALVGGMCETDYSGYPDCRERTVKAMAAALSLGMDRCLKIETPLMWLDKSEAWQLAADTGGPALVDMILERTHTCYLGVREERHDWGYGCGECPACQLRKNGWRIFARSWCQGSDTLT